MIAPCTVLCGRQTAADMARFADSKEAYLCSFLKRTAGLPSRDTFSRLFRLLDPATFSARFRRLDVVMNEDQARNRAGDSAHNLAVPRYLPVNVMQKDGITKSLHENSRDPDGMESISITYWHCSEMRLPRSALSTPGKPTSMIPIRGRRGRPPRRKPLGEKRSCPTPIGALASAAP